MFHYEAKLCIFLNCQRIPLYDRCLWSFFDLVLSLIEQANFQTEFEIVCLFSAQISLVVLFPNWDLWDIFRPIWPKTASFDRLNKNSHNLTNLTKKISSTVIDPSVLLFDRQDQIKTTL